MSGSKLHLFAYARADWVFKDALDVLGYSDAAEEDFHSFLPFVGLPCCSGQRGLVRYASQLLALAMADV